MGVNLIPSIFKGQNKKIDDRHKHSLEIDSYKKLDPKRIKNIDIKCDKCGNETTIYIYGGLNRGVRCPVCGKTIKGDIDKRNFRPTEHTPIIDSSSIPIRRTMFIKHKR